MKGGRVYRIRVYILVGAYADAGNALAFFVGRTSGPGFVVVVDNVHFHAFATVASVSSEVVYHVVAHVHAFVKLCGGTRTETWRTACVMCNEIVVERSARSAPVASVAMVAFGVTRVYETLRYDAPLQGGILVAKERTALVNAPAHGAMVYHDAFLIHASEGIPSVCTVFQYVFVAKTEAHIAYDDIVAFHANGIVGYADTVTGCSLAGNGGVACDV